MKTSTMADRENSGCSDVQVLVPLQRFHEGRPRPNGYDVCETGHKCRRDAALVYELGVMNFEELAYAGPSVYFAIFPCDI